jgi:serine/threonine protein kinase
VQQVVQNKNIQLPCTIKHYQLLEFLGGGMSRVYRARDTLLDRMVALKFLPAGNQADGDAENQFLQEARAASALDHTNICPVFSIEKSPDGLNFICMPYYAGRTLKQICRDGPMEPDRVLHLSLQIASGLEASHRNGIVHCDIKPANILITPESQVKIVDFGIARLLRSQRGDSFNGFSGTIDYMSPEQLQNNPVDQRSDIWSFGVTLFEMLTGRLPFNGHCPQALMYSILNEEPDYLSSPRLKSFRKILSAILQKEPEMRYASVTPLLYDLHKLARRRWGRLPQSPLNWLLQFQLFLPTAG